MSILETESSKSKWKLSSKNQSAVGLIMHKQPAVSHLQPAERVLMRPIFCLPTYIDNNEPSPRQRTNHTWFGNPANNANPPEKKTCMTTQQN